MPTIAEHIGALQEARRAAERRQSDADATLKRLLNKATAEGRDNLTEAEDARLRELIEAKRAAKEEISRLDGRIEEARRVEAEEDDIARQAGESYPTEAGRRMHQGARVQYDLGASRQASTDDDPRRFIRLADGRPAALARGQSWRDHPVVAEYAAARDRAEQAVIGQHGSIGNQLRAMTTTSGSAVVPTVWAADIIDRARALAAVTQAGAEIVPMDAKVVNIGRLTTDPTAAFRTEGSTVTASDPVFDNVTLTAKTLSALVIGSMEWFQDAPNVDEVVSSAIAKAIALTLDQQALFGGITTGGETGATGFNTTFPTPPNPRGVLASLLADAASSVLGSGANGTAQTALTYWNEVIQTVFLPQTFNEQPGAILWNAKLAQQYASGYDSTGQPLAVPAAIASMPKFVTNQIPSFTQGTMTTRATDLFVGDWSQLLIGQRLDLTVQTLVERYAELGQIGIIAHWRGDVALARPRAFAVYRYLQGAA
jgi:HK97 family phage major capsid protein